MPFQDIQSLSQLVRRPVIKLDEHGNGDRRTLVMDCQRPPYRPSLYAKRSYVDFLLPRSGPFTYIIYKYTMTLHNPPLPFRD